MKRKNKIIEFYRINIYICYRGKAMGQIITPYRPAIVVNPICFEKVILIALANYLQLSL